MAMSLTIQANVKNQHQKETLTKMQIGTTGLSQEILTAAACKILLYSFLKITAQEHYSLLGLLFLSPLY